ncbi:MerR family transcriptional regulator [Desulfobacter latus]|uniref:MerR family transcriptional regulator n=1 Tax=Desulfobacter latus TaxID=2292 RepID=A0A850SSJ8_9BACT|nr:MerR family transcriptional regulator [Desulfobacter latus]NWH04119.1 MerR family transcriptional regulator [Desulfobacter latus]
MTYGVAETARIFGVDIQQLKTWAYQFRDNLSASTDPQKGMPRIFTEEDVLTLLYVNHFWEDEPDVGAIVAGLNSGCHFEAIYVHTLWNHTGFASNKRMDHDPAPDG